MLRNIFGRLRAWYQVDKNRGIKLGILLLLALLGAGLFAKDYMDANTPIDGIIARGSYGEGTKKKTFDVKIGEEDKTTIDVEVSEQMYTEKELKKIFAQCMKEMDQLILGDNKSLNHVEQNLNLVTEFPKKPISISWKCDNYEVINVNGEIQTDRVNTKGSLVHLTATLTYKEKEDQQAIYACNAVIYPKTLTKQETLVQLVVSAIQKENEDTRTKNQLVLPRKLSKTDVIYYPVLQTRGLVLTALAIIVGILLIALEKQNQEDVRKLRLKEMQRDYPEVVSKLTLLFGSGMTLKRSWIRIVDDYEREKGTWGEREVYEEMKITKKEMESGVIESSSYEHFGKRCELQEYIRLGALLSQNLRKGTKGLTKLLEEESRQALENRKAMAKRLGEEAGTKLLAPMFLMLAVVLIMIIVPAFLSVQM